MMKNRFTYIICLMLCHSAKSQSGGGLEHYYYMSKNKISSMVPIVHYNSSTNWYGEVRYNYEDVNTLSLYGGKTFSKEGKWSFSATPLVGGMIGTMKGGSVGLNFDLDYNKVFLSSQSQYSFSMNDRTNKYFFTWSEAGYQALTWCYAGVALQQTSMYKQSGQWETGYLVGVSFRSWTVPLYAFNISKQERYFILGVNWEWQNKAKKIQTVVYE